MFLLSCCFPEKEEKCNNKKALGKFSVLHVIVLLDFAKMPLDFLFDRGGLLTSQKCYLQGLDSGKSSYTLSSLLFSDHLQKAFMIGEL
jgi:hypothetical protein